MMLILNNPFLGRIKIHPSAVLLNFQTRPGTSQKEGVMFNSRGSMRLILPWCAGCIAQEATPTFELENWCQNQELQHSWSSPQVSWRVPCWIPVGLDDIENSMPKNCFGYNCFLCLGMPGLHWATCPPMSILACQRSQIYIYTLSTVMASINPPLFNPKVIYIFGLWIEYGLIVSVWFFQVIKRRIIYIYIDR